MSDAQMSRLRPEALDHLAESLARVGVAGNESGLGFDAQDVRTSWQALEERLKRSGYVGGALSMNPPARPHDEIDLLIYDSHRYEGLAQAERAWEDDHYHVSRDKIARRVQDWLGRLATLRAQMAEWVVSPEFSRLSVVGLPPAPMFEELMRRFDVPSADMPVFEFRDGERRVMRVKPKGLWIIGANGRVDLITRSAAPILFDRSEPLSRPSDWRLYDQRAPGKFAPLSRESFTALMRAGLP